MNGENGIRWKFTKKLDDIDFSSCHTENVGKEIADPVVVEIKPANGVSKANEAAATNGNAAATNGNAAKPMLAENGGAEKDKADGSEKTETTDEKKEANQVGIISIVSF